MQNTSNKLVKKLLINLFRNLSNPALQLYHGCDGMRLFKRFSINKQHIVHFAINTYHSKKTLQTRLGLIVFEIDMKSALRKNCFQLKSPCRES